MLLIRLTDRSGNVVSGLCVDTAITAPSRRRQDFYLQSQCGLKGSKLFLMLFYFTSDLIVLFS